MEEPKELWHHVKARPATWPLRTDNYQRAIAQLEHLPMMWDEEAADNPCVSAHLLWPGQLKILHNESILYKPTTCTVHRLSAWHARACLMNTHILFLGDSLTRYQYMSLVHFISRLEFPDQFGSDPAGPNVCLEREWTDWNDFYHIGSAVLSNARGAHGFELIDADHGSEKENRIFNLTDMHGHSNATITLQHQRITTAATDAILAVFEDIEQKVSMNDVNDIPNVIIVNTGLWSINRGEQIDLDLIRQRGERLHSASRGNVKLIWKTTTNTKLSDHQDDMRAQRELTVFHGVNNTAWQCLDAYEVSLSFKDNGLDLYWDGYHFLPIGYGILNDVLLHTLCNIG